MVWFGKTWIGRIVSFEGATPTAWILQRKLTEHISVDNRDPAHAEVKGVFVCSKSNGLGPAEAVIKVRMQIPLNLVKHCRSNESTEHQLRAECYSGIGEEKALRILTEKGCSSTPKLIASKSELQTVNMPFPNGYMFYILMTKVPGVSLSSVEELSKTECHSLRAAFKNAWLDCYHCSVVSADFGLRNLLWHREEQKCYLVDFEDWDYSFYYNGWIDNWYDAWGLL